MQLRAKWEKTKYMDQDGSLNNIISRSNFLCTSYMGNHRKDIIIIWNHKVLKKIYH